MVQSRLKELREAKGLSRPEIAVHCEIGEAQVRRWESGESLIPTKYLLALCERLDVSADHLLGWDRTEAEVAS